MVILNTEGEIFSLQSETAGLLMIDGLYPIIHIYWKCLIVISMSRSVPTKGTVVVILHLTSHQFQSDSEQVLQICVRHVCISPEKTNAFAYDV